MTVTDSLNRSSRGHDVETPTASDRDPADILASFLAMRNDGLDEIAGAKTFDGPRRFGRCARKAVPVPPAHLPRIVTDGLDAQRLDSCRIDLLRGVVTDACRIDPMLFGQAPLRAVEFRQPARTSFNRRLEALEPISSTH